MTTIYQHAMKLLGVATDVMGCGVDAEDAHELILQASFLLQRQDWRDKVDALLSDLPDFDEEPMLSERAIMPIGTWLYMTREHDVNLVIGARDEQHAGAILHKLSDAGLVEGYDEGEHDQYVGATDIVSPYGWVGFRMKKLDPIG